MKKLTIEQRKRLHGLGFVSPWIFGLLLFWIYPVITSFVMSLNKIKPKQVTYIWEFVGLDNYNRVLLRESAFLEGFLPYLFKTIIVVPIIVLFAVIVALLLNENFYGRGFFRAVFFLPVLFTTGGVIISLLTNNGSGGTADTATNMTASASTATVSFLTNSALTDLIKSNFSPKLADALVSVLESFILILWYAGIQITLLIAGIQSIPQTIYEAAAIDGANSWEKLWTITLPGILPFILISLIYTLVDQCTVVDNPVMTMITDALNTNIETQGMGYASTVGWLFQFVIMVLIGLIFLLFQKSTAQPK